jgi:hypothetical protein
MFAQVSVAGGPSGFVAAWPRFWTSPSGNQQAAWTRGVSTDGVVLGPTPALSSPNSYADHVRVSLGGDGNGLVAWDSPVGVRSIDVSGAPTSSITDLGSSFDSRYPLSAFSRKADAGAVIWQNPGYDTVPDTGLIAFQLGPVACADVTATATQGSPVSIPLSCSGAGISSATVLGGPSHGTIDGLPIPGGLKFVYRPAKDFVGPDVFAFRVANPVGVSNVTHARISVNRAPVAKRKRLSKIFRLRILRRGGLRLVLRMYAGVRVRIAVTSRSGTRWKKVRSVTIKRKRPGTVRVRLGSKATAAHHRHRTIRVRVVAPATSSTEAQRVTRFIKGR